MTSNNKCLQPLNTLVKYMIGAGVLPMRRIVEERKVIYEPYEDDRVTGWIKRAQCPRSRLAVVVLLEYVNQHHQRQRGVWRRKVFCVFVTRIGHVPKGQYDVTRSLLSYIFGSLMSSTAAKFAMSRIRPSRHCKVYIQHHALKGSDSGQPL